MMKLNSDQKAQAALLWKKVKKLQAARKKAFEEHEVLIKKHPPKWDCDLGCAEAANIADQIQQLIKTGQMLGLIDKKIDYINYLN